MILAERDPFGLVPWYFSLGETLGEPAVTVGNTMQECRDQGAAWSSLRLLPAGHILEWDGTWATVTRVHKWDVERLEDDRDTAAGRLRTLLLASCEEEASEGRQAILLSGGIDSAAVAVGLLNAGMELTAYTAVYDPKSPDLKSARQVAAHLGLELIEVEIPHPSEADLRETIRVIEMPWKAQVEIGWPCLVLGEVIAAAGHQIVYGGEGSDELWASHAFAFHERARPGAGDFHDYRQADFEKQASRNFIREWKVWNRHGLAVRLPFLNEEVVEYILGLGEETCRDATWHAKRPLQQAFRPYLPEWVCARQKLGFQDGLLIKPAIAEGFGLSQRDVGSWYRRQYAELFPGAPL